MSLYAKWAVGGLLVLLGLILTWSGLSYAVRLGSRGNATFSASGTAGSGPIVVPSTMLNRVDSDVEITAIAKANAPIWIGAARPTDLRAVLGGAAHQRASGVSTRSWSVDVTRTGKGAAPDLQGTDVWRTSTSAPGKVSATIVQKNAPESVVVQSSSGQIERVELTWRRGTWFGRAVATAVIGLLLLASGAVLLWSLRSSRGSAIRDGDGGTDHRGEGDDSPSSPFEQAAPTTLEVNR